MPGLSEGKPQLSLGRDGSMEKFEDDSFPDAQTILNKFLEESAEED